VVHAEFCYSVFFFTYFFILINLQMYAIKIIITITTAAAGQLLQKHAGLSLVFWDHLRIIFGRACASVLVGKPTA